MDELIDCLFDAEVLFLILLHNFAHAFDDLIWNAGF